MMKSSGAVRKFLLGAVAAQILGIAASAPLVFGVTPLKLALFLTLGQLFLLISVILYVIAVILELRSERIL